MIIPPVSPNIGRTLGLHPWRNVEKPSSTSFVRVVTLLDHPVVDVEDAEDAIFSCIHRLVPNTHLPQLVDSGHLLVENHISRDLQHCTAGKAGHLDLRLDNLVPVVVVAPVGPNVRWTCRSDTGRNVDEPDRAGEVLMVARLHHPVVDVHRAELSVCSLMDDPSIRSLLLQIHSRYISVKHHCGCN